MDPTAYTPLKGNNEGTESPRRRNAFLSVVGINILIIVGLVIAIGIYIYSSGCKPLVPVTTNIIKRPRALRFAAVTSEDKSCAKIGNTLLARYGGTAVDAAVATILCQCAMNIHMCGIGGGLMATLYKRKTQTIKVVNAQEIAPGSVTEGMFVNKSANARQGGKAIGIPGFISGLRQAWNTDGKLPWKTLFEPTIKLLKTGISVRKPLAFAIKKIKGILVKYKNLKKLLTNPKTKKLYKEGEIMKMPVLARTLELISHDGPHSFYKGTLKDLVIKDIKEAGGIIIDEDFGSYEPAVAEPLTSKMKDNSTVATLPPPSSGASVMMLMKIIDEYGSTLKSNVHVVRTWHRVVEAFKFAYADRSNLGDANVENKEVQKQQKQLVDKMISRYYAKMVISNITDSKTHSAAYYGSTFYDKSYAGASHVSVLAPNGDAVSLSTSINSPFGSKVVGSKTGIIFNNAMAQFCTPNTENAFGVPAPKINFIKPFKRPLSAMSPMMVIDKKGNVRYVTGASGGIRIPSAITQVAVRTLWREFPVKKAIEIKRIHHQLLPNVLEVEKGYAKNIVEGLRKKGHKIKLVARAPSAVQVIYRESPWKIAAGADARRSDSGVDGY